jgi:hypothetical protein
VSDDFKHLDVKKVSERELEKLLRIARYQGQWTSAKSLKYQAESLGASDVMMRQFDIHINRVEEQLLELHGQPKQEDIVND